MILRAALLTVVVVAAVAAPASAATRVLPATQVFPGERWVGVGDAHTVVTTDTAGQTIEHRDDGMTRWIAPPQGCSVVAAGGGRLLYHNCPGAPPQQQRLLTTALDGSDPVTIDEPLATGADGAANDYRAIGATWIAAVVAGYHYTNDLFVNWRTGSTRVITDSDFANPMPDPTTLVLDLDAPEPFRPCCATLAERGHDRAPWTDLDLMALRDSSSYGLITTPSGTTLWRCGEPHALVGLPASATIVALHRGWLVAITGRRAALTRLRDGRRYTARLPIAPWTVGFTAHAFYGHAARPYTAEDVIERIALPSGA